MFNGSLLNILESQTDFDNLYVDQYNLEMSVWLTALNNGDYNTKNLDINRPG